MPGIFLDTATLSGLQLAYDGEVYKLKVVIRLVLTVISTTLFWLAVFKRSQPKRFFFKWSVI